MLHCIGLSVNISNFVDPESALGAENDGARMSLGSSAMLPTDENIPKEPEAKNPFSNFETPLLIAVSHDNIHAIRGLMKCGADANQKNSVGRSYSVQSDVRMCLPARFVC